MNTRLLLLLAVFWISQFQLLFAQSAYQRQQQQQRYQQQQRQQQQYQRQLQIQARQQRLQQLQQRQYQLQQRQQQLQNRRPQLKPNRPNLTSGGFGGRSVVRKTTTLKSSGQTVSGQQVNRIGRSRVLASSRTNNYSSGPKPSVPLAKSPQVLQAKASLDTNKLSVLRTNLQKNLQARSPSDSALKSPSNAANLKKQLASQQQMSEKGADIAGGNSKVPFRDATRVAKLYGGNPEDWVKKSSSTYRSADGQHIETHWVENQKTGEKKEFKTIVSPDQKSK